MAPRDNRPNASRPRSTKDLERLLIEKAPDPDEFRARLEDERLNQEIAEWISDQRKARGLSQTELAHKVGTSQSAIARLERMSYRGHSLGMLRRIAAALDATLDIRIGPKSGILNS